jgi:uncharacterized iron-regulated membrane protein
MMERKTAFYRMIWRWHFYAGLFVMPFILILSVTGAIYLFKPQVERWEERSFQGQPVTNSVGANVQLAAAMAAFPGSKFDSYRLPEQAGDAALIHLALADGKQMRDVFVSPQGKVLGSLDPEMRLMEIDSKIHGSLMAGRFGSWLVELAASWAIVMILTGLYLWWPAKEGGGRRGLVGVVWPRLQAGKRIFMRDLHAVTGFWVSGLALILLVTGMPWASVWGDAFKMVRAEMGWVQEKQDWKTGGKSADENGVDEHAEHNHEAMMRMQAANIPLASLDDIVTKAGNERLAFPVIVKSDAMMWSVKSDAQNRSLRTTITYDGASGKELSRQDFADRHPIDKAVGYGIAWHEGQLFGWINQLIGVLTALALITMTVSGFILWRRRKPVGSLGAPPLSKTPKAMAGVIAIMLVLAALLPLLALSLVCLVAIEYVLTKWFPASSHWLGLGQ